MPRKHAMRPSLAIGLILLSIGLAAATVSAQVQDLSPRFIRVQQEKVHEQMLAGSAGDPWQYRILTDALMEPLIEAAQARGIPAASYQVFVGTRFLQCLLIFLAAGVYFRRLSLRPMPIAIGLSMLAWSMSLSLYNSDLSFSVFFDVAFYLLAAVFILHERPWWIALLMIPAAFNRETSLLIPVLLVIDAYFRHGPGPARRTSLMAAVVGMLMYVVIYVGLRLYYGPQPFLSADGYSPGLSLLLLNLRRPATWQQLLIVLGAVPVLAALTYRRWPQALRLMFWTVVPLWVAVHFTAALVAEARLMLVPQALVFIPGVLVGLSTEDGRVGEEVQEPSD